jgi:serine/threonine-protein kinase
VPGYRIEEEAGRGGWSVVYRAVELASGRTVALKMVDAEHVEVVELRARFRRERRVAAALEHPSVIPVVASGDGFIAMKWVDATRLSQRLPIAPARAARIAAQVAEALDAVHAAGFVHRDVKPGNVLVGATDRAYLTDFGLAKEISGDPGLTDEGRWLGTVGYAAPEQIRGRPAGERSDVYSLGATLYEAVTGTPPYPGRSDADTMQAHLNDPPPRHDSPLDGVVRRAMAKAPEERFTSAGELGRAALEAVA